VTDTVRLRQICRQTQHAVHRYRRPVRTET